MKSLVAIVRASVFAPLALVLLLGGTGPGQAGTIFSWTCDTPLCAMADPGLKFEIEVADSVVTPNSVFIGVDGNVLGISIMSDIGDGISLSLPDLGSASLHIDPNSPLDRGPYSSSQRQTPTHFFTTWGII